MEKPSYANAFVISYNSQMHEVVINFAQEYPVIDNDSAKASSKERVNVSGIALPESLASQLLGALNNLLNSEQIDG